MSTDLLPVVEAELCFLATEDGGRETPPALGDEEARYRPHIVVGDPTQREAVVVNRTITEEYLGVEFGQSSSPIALGATTRLSMRLAFYPTVDYSQAVPGATFTVREGAKVVAYGTILERRDP